MPTFKISDEDLEVDCGNVDDDVDFLGRYWGKSMKFLRLKKFQKTHQKISDAHKEEEKLRAEAREAAKAEFERKEAEHWSRFVPKPLKKPVDIAEVYVSESELERLRKEWIQEYAHPSCTAGINVEGIIGDSPSAAQSGVAAGFSSKPVKNLISGVTRDSTPSALVSSPKDAPTPGSLFQIQKQQRSVLSAAKNSTPSSTAGLSTEINTSSNNCPRNSNDSFFDMSSVTLDDSVFHKNESTSTTPKQSNRVFKIDSYDGGRPSFAHSIVTSTPINKQFPEKPSLAVVTEESVVEVNDPVSPNRSTSANAPKPLSEQVAPPSVSAPSTSTSNAFGYFYAQEMDEQENNLLAKERFEQKNPTLRASIKRVVFEKISISVKRFSKDEEIQKLAKELYNVISERKIDGIVDPDGIAYVYNLILNMAIGMADRDENLAPVLAKMLRLLAAFDRKFATVTVGTFLSKSTLLRLDMEECKPFALKLCEDSADVKRRKMSEERTAIRLFVLIHDSSSKEFPMKNLWRLTSFVTNSDVLLATVTVLSEVISHGSPMLSKAYPRQWPKLMELVKVHIIPRLEKNLLASSERQKVGEAAQISVLNSLLALS